MTPENLRKALATALEQGMTYEEYSALNKEMAKEGRTTGPQTEAFVEYTKLGAARLRRWEKMYRPHPSFLKLLDGFELDGDQWLLFSETWCGDAAHNLPFIAHWAEYKGIPLRIILRDEHTDLMDQFLTNGGRSIPKLVRMGSDFTVKGTWGPRPEALQSVYLEWRAKPEFDYKEWALFAQEWYNSDRGTSLEQEFLELLSHDHAFDPTEPPKGPQPTIN